MYDITNLITNFTQQHTNNNDYYHSVIQILTNKNLIKENEELWKEIEGLKIENKELKKEVKENELKKVYRFLAYLIDDWSNRAWVISEYQIAKEKYKQYGTPLKYVFLSLLKSDKPFFSYHFDDDDDDDDSDQLQFATNNGKLAYEAVDNSIKFNQFVKERFMQRSHFNMILNSNATRNEDRFNAILPSWDKYIHVIKNKNTISDWNITDMTSVRVKLYEIMNGYDNDLREKERLLYACSHGGDKTILPSFASIYENKFLALVEKGDIRSTYQLYKLTLLKYIQKEKEKEHIKQLINEYKMKSKPIWAENLTSIQLDHHHHYQYLSVKSNNYFIMDIDECDKKFILSYRILLVEHGDYLTRYAYIPFFTFIVPDCIDIPPTEIGTTSVHLLGNINQNKWLLIRPYIQYFKKEHFCSDDYIFNIH